MNEIKVGEWCRVNRFLKIKYEIFQVKESTKIINADNFKEKYFCEDGNVLGTIVDHKENLTDLLKIGDIVHFAYLEDTMITKKGDVSEMTMTYQGSIDNIKLRLNENKIKIIAIELVENRQIQKLGE